jgi:hypothetical protein
MAAELSIDAASNAATVKPDNSGKCINRDGVKSSQIRFCISDISKLLLNSAKKIAGQVAWKRNGAKPTDYVRLRVDQVDIKEVTSLRIVDVRKIAFIGRDQSCIEWAIENQVAKLEDPENEWAVLLETRPYCTVPDLCCLASRNSGHRNLEEICASLQKLSASAFQRCQRDWI